MVHYNWMLLLLAGVFEIGMTMALRFSDGFSKLWPSLGFVITAALSFYLFSIALKSIPLGIAYAVWTSIGVVGTVVIGDMIFGEKLGVVQYICILQIIIGVVVLKISCKN